MKDGRVINIVAHKPDQLASSGIRAHHELGALLAAQGLPVRAPFDPRIMEMTRGTRHSLIALYTYLPGHTIPWEAYTRTHIKLLGYALARFHAAAQGARSLALPDVESDYRAIVTRMMRYFADPRVADALSAKCGIRIDHDKLGSYIPFLGACQDLPGRQPLHMDFVRGNILFGADTSDDAISLNGIQVSGIIDLEKAAIGHPLFDAARTLAFLLVDCPRPAEKLVRYFLDSGYIKRGGIPLKPLQAGGHDVLGTLIDMFLTYDLYKFLRDNPYESLAKNHHFIGTRDTLLARGLVY